MEIQEEIEIIQDAVDTFGFKNQVRMLQEECAELITAANHYERGREGAYDNFIEELADVDIMMNQMIYGLHANMSVVRQQKLLRLKDRIKEYKKGDKKGECLLFPSKDNRDGSTFKAPKEEYKFKPFEKVLVRDNNDEEWRCSMFSTFNKGGYYQYLTISGSWKQCIPYEVNEHLLGTTNNVN